MKQALLLIFILVIACTAAGISAREKIKQQFKGPEEPTAKDAIWTSETMFKVGVIDNGLDRSGYADYVCGEINAAGIRQVDVQIIDIAKLARQNKWVKLGTAKCR